MMNALALILWLASSSFAAQGYISGPTISTGTGKVSLSYAGVLNVAASSATISTPTISLNGTGGLVTATVFNASATLYADSFPGADIGAKINAALAAIPSGGGEIRLSPGSYTDSTSVLISNKSNIAFVGIGFPTLNTSTDTFDVFIVTGTSSNIRIEGFIINGLGIAESNPSAALTQAAVRVTGGANGTRLVFKKNTVQGVPLGVIISSEGFSDCDISDNIFQNLVGNTSGHAATYTISSRNSITRNKFLNIPRHDVYLSGSNGRSATFNVVADNTDYNNGIEAFVAFAKPTESPVIGNIFSNNTIMYPQNIAIGLDQQAVGNLITGNTIIGAYSNIVGSVQGTIQLNGAVSSTSYPNNNVVSNNVIMNSTGTQPCIWVSNSNFNEVTGNSLNNANDIGIEVSNSGVLTSTGNVISNNTIYGSTRPLFDGGAFSTVWSGNVMSFVPFYNNQDSGSIFFGNVVVTTNPVTNTSFDVYSVRQGVGVPRLTTTQVQASIPLATGKIIFNTTLGLPCYSTGTVVQAYSRFTGTTTCQ